MKKNIFGVLLLVFFTLPAVSVKAHYGMVIPSDTMVMQEDNRKVTLTLSFSHPFEGIGMVLEKPSVFNVDAHGQTRHLLENLKTKKVMGQTAWSMDYTVKRPGACTFYMEPAPYWEPAEDRFIIHYTKTVIAAFGDDEGWDREVGLKTEIVPLSKPFGLYVGNVFQGIVKLDGKAVPYADVEVEYYNQGAKFRAPADYMVTQTIRADGNGVFTYSAPGAGWWGFAALNDADFKIKHQGQEKDVELGAVIWVKFHDWQGR
jgi:cobalt/nickel transport protein